MSDSRVPVPLDSQGRTFLDRNALWVLMAFVFLLPTVLMMARTAVQSHQNKVQDWLPKGYSETRELAEFRRNFSADQFVVVSWDGCRIEGDPETSFVLGDDPRIERLARLLGQSEPWASIESARTPGAGNTAGTGAAPVDPNERPSPADAAGLNARPEDAKGRAASEFATEEERRLSEELQKYVAKVTTARGTLWTMTAGDQALSYPAAVKRLNGTLLGPDGNKTCLVIHLTDSAIGNFRELLARPTSGWLRVLHPEGLIFRALRAAGVDPEQAVIGGPPVDNVSIDQEGQRTLLRLAGLAGLLGLLLAWWSLRSIFLTAIVFSCGIVSAAGSLALVALMGEHTDAILFSMPPLVYVLAMSGAVHLINYYRDSVREHGQRYAVERALSMGWKPALLCSVTTAFGLLSLCTSDLTPIRKFGIFSASGVVLMLATLFLFLPAMLKLFPGSLQGRGRRDLPASSDRASDSTEDSLSERFWMAVGGSIVRHYGLVAVGCVLLIGVAGWGLTRVRSSVDLMKLFGPEARILHDYQWLEQNIGRLVPLEIVLRFDSRSMTDEKEDALAVAAGKPVRKTLSMLERFELVRSVQRRIDRTFGATGSDLVSPSTSVCTFVPPAPADRRNGLSSAKRTLMEVSLENNFQSLCETGYLARDERTGDELWRISVRVAAFRDVDYGQFTGDIREVVDPFVAESIRGLSGLRPAVRTTYTGVIPIVYKAQRALLESLISSTWWSFASITPLLMLVSRGFWAGLVAMLPNILPVVAIFGAMGWLNVNVDIGSMMAASIALGVAVDDTIHYLTWFRHELDATGCRKLAILGAYRHCATPTLQAALISGLGLSVFAFSTFMPTRKFGYLMLTILVAGMVAELILLPALLASPLGRVFKPARKEEPADEQLRIAA